jgi:hypothetical protein
MALTLQRLKELLDYNPETGIFTWRKQPRQRVMSKSAGTINNWGYRHKAHRLAWFYVHGEWPAEQVDHANGNRDDNRISNLREASFSQNQANARKRVTSENPYKGVSFHRHSRLWVARVTRNRRVVFCAYFPTPEEARDAYVENAKRAFGEFARAA